MTKPGKHPCCHVIAGPNGAGKSTFALEYLPTVAKCSEFVNADLIAAGLSPLRPASAALRAGRLVLERIHELAKARKDFGFETTLSGQSYLPLLRGLTAGGFRIVLYYLWLPSSSFASKRVRGRVLMGGHDIPRKDIVRRYKRSLENLPQYCRIAAELYLFDASTTPVRLILSRTDADETVHDPAVLKHIRLT